MVTEDYVDFETAKLLKAKGADFDTDNVYTSMGRSWEVNMKKFNYAEYNVSGYVKRPTLQMAMKWLREVHNICISVDVKIGGGKYYVCISSIENGLSHGVLEDEVWDTFEEACDESIKYCLKKLI